MATFIFLMACRAPSSPGLGVESHQLEDPPKIYSAKLYRQTDLVDERRWKLPPEAPMLLGDRFVLQLDYDRKVQFSGGVRIVVQGTGHRVERELTPEQNDSDYRHILVYQPDESDLRELSGSSRQVSLSQWNVNVGEGAVVPLGTVDTLEVAPWRGENPGTVVLRLIGDVGDLTGRDFNAGFPLLLEYHNAGGALLRLRTQSDKPLNFIFTGENPVTSHTLPDDRDLLTLLVPWDQLASAEDLSAIVAQVVQIGRSAQSRYRIPLVKDVKLVSEPTGPYDENSTLHFVAKLTKKITEEASGTLQFKLGGNSDTSFSVAFERDPEMDPEQPGLRGDYKWSSDMVPGADGDALTFVTAMGVVEGLVDVTGAPFVVASEQVSPRVDVVAPELEQPTLRLNGKEFSGVLEKWDAGQLTMQLTFSEPVQLGSGAIVIKPSGAVQLTFPAADEPFSQIYSAVVTPKQDVIPGEVTITVPGTAYQDKAGHSGRQAEQVKLGVDSIPPEVNGLAQFTTKGVVASGYIELRVPFSEAVVVDMTEMPSIALKVGAVAAVAVYDSGSGTAELSFRYPVAELAGKVKIPGGTVIAHKGSIADLAGNRLLSGAVTNGNDIPSLTLDNDVPSPTIDFAPVILAITTSTQGNIGPSGTVLTFTFSKKPVFHTDPATFLGFLETITVTDGTLSDGRPGANGRTFTAVFKPEDGVDGNVTVSVAAGTDADPLFVDEVGNRGKAASATFAVDTKGPAVSRLLIADAARGTMLYATFDEDVQVSNASSATLSFNGGADTATFRRFDAPRTLVFASDLKTGGEVRTSRADRITLGGAEIKDAVGNSATLSLPDARAPPEKLVASATHSLEIDADGVLYAWGRNDEGQLGQFDRVDRSQPARVSGGWEQVAAGENYSLALKGDGTLWAWGSNTVGQLGLGDTNERGEPTRVGDATTWALVAAGARHSLALKSDGTLWAWGSNEVGQLGLGFSGGNKESPQRVDSDTDWAQIAAGRDYSLALKSDGSLYAWGYNNLGQLGRGDTTDRGRPTRVGRDSDWAQIAAGGSHSLALKSDGSLYAWGYNNLGQLGRGDTRSQFTPEDTRGGTGWVRMTAGGSHSLAVSGAGRLYAWGGNDEGQLGLGGTVPQTSSPWKVNDDTDWVQLAAGESHTLALKSDGGLYAWGKNDVGQLGLGSVTDRELSPERVEFDTTAPRLTIDRSSGTIGSDGTVLTFRFSEVPVFRNRDASFAKFLERIDVPNAAGTLSEGPQGTDGRTFTATFTPAKSFDGNATVIVPAGSDAAPTFTDKAGNHGLGASVSVSGDTKAPTLALTSDATTTLKQGGTVTITFRFSEVPFFRSSDASFAKFLQEKVSVVGGGLSDGRPAVGDERSFVATFTPTDGFDGNATIRVAAGTDAAPTYTDEAGNHGQGASVSVSCDAQAPTLIITSREVASLQSGATHHYTLTFSEPLKNVATVDQLRTLITARGGGFKVTAFSVADGGSWVGAVTFTAGSREQTDAGITVGRFTDLVGNEVDTARSTMSSRLTIDNTAPHVSGAEIKGYDDTSGDEKEFLKEGDTIHIVLTFSDPVRVDGTPELSFTVGSVGMAAGSARLVGDTVHTDVDGVKYGNDVEFSKRVGSTDNGKVVVKKSATTSGEGEIKDEAGNAVDNSTIGASYSGPTVDNSVLRVGKVEVTGYAADSATTKDFLRQGDTINIVLTFTKLVRVSGTPTLTFAIGSDANVVAHFTGMLDEYGAPLIGDAKYGTEVKFSKIVGSDENGEVVVATTATISGGEGIKDRSGNAFTLPTLGTPGRERPTVDNGAPTVSGVEIKGYEGSSSTLRTTNLLRGDTVKIVLTFNEPVSVSGTPTLPLRVGSDEVEAGVAKLVGSTLGDDGARYSKEIEFSRVVGPHENGQVAVAASAVMNGKAGIEDRAGNAFDSVKLGVGAIGPTVGNSTLSPS